MLNRPPRADQDQDERIFGTHPGDIGVVVIAALCTIAMLVIFFTPSPFARLEKAQEQQAKIARQKEIDKAVATGEVDVSIAPAKHH